ncbi:hypothetical protein DFS34DRAFT_600178 [Phlyctochytrium arcticum]|nr:hypothetical protein DFS34DRAFT_600178 [Phlyctochytrium arcticum]
MSQPLVLKDEDSTERNERLKNVALASQVEDTERQRAEQELIHAETNSELHRRQAGKEADRAMDDERQRRMAEESLIAAQQELLRKQALQTAIKLEEEEQQRRIQEGHKAVALTDVVRKNTARRADMDMDAEKERRTSTENLADIPDELVQQKRQLQQDVVQSFATKHHSASNINITTEPAYGYASGPRSENNVPRTPTVGEAQNVTTRSDAITAPERRLSAAQLGQK